MGKMNPGPKTNAARKRFCAKLMKDKYGNAKMVHAPISVLHYWYQNTS